jgi:hypothetical protein
VTSIPATLTDLYRPLLLKAIKTAGPRTRALLRPVVEIALARIEVLCPPGLVQTNTGTDVVRGPPDYTAQQLLPVLAATVKASFVCALMEWPEPGSLVPPPGLSAGGLRIEAWSQIACGVEEQNVDLVAPGVAALLITRGDVDQLRDSTEHARTAGATPLLVVLCVRRVQRHRTEAGGAVCLLPLPPSLAEQTARAEQATREVVH